MSIYKSLDEVVKTLQHRTTKVLLGILTATILFNNRHKILGEPYQNFPQQTAKILREYDTGIQGLYTPGDLKNLLENYELRKKDSEYIAN